jgi:hypothetical protein
MNYVLIAVIVIFVIIILSASIKVVREYQRLVVFRLGRSIGAKGPGLVFLIPIVDKPVWADLRELYLEIPSQTCITKDNAPIDIDFLIYWRVLDPATSVIAVGNYAGASQKIATTTLRAVIGDIPLDDVPGLLIDGRLVSQGRLPSHDELRELLRTVFPEVQMRGVCGNERVMAFERARGAQAGKILRLDPLGLRHLLPRTLIEWAYPRLARLVRRNITADGASATIEPDDFHISDHCEGSLDLLAMCGNSKA